MRTIISSTRSKNWVEEMKRSRTSANWWSIHLNSCANCWSLRRLFSETSWVRSKSWRTDA